MKSLVRLFFCAVALAFAGSAPAQDFPTKPLRIIVPFPPGGAADLFARQLGNGMGRILKQPVVVDNVGGAGGTLGIEQGLRAAADGYTWVLNPCGAVAIAPFVRQLSYAPLKDLSLLTLVAKVPQVIVISDAVPASNFKELVAYAKANPGKINYASSGPGSISHLAGELLKYETRTEMVHVPYKGATPALHDLLGNMVQLAVLDESLVLPYIKAGKIKAIAITSNQRVPELPNVPSTKELGYAKVNSDNWFGLVGSAQVPPAIQRKVAEAAVATLKDPALIESFRKLPATPIPSTPGEFRNFLEAESSKWGSIVKAIGYKE